MNASLQDLTRTYISVDGLLRGDRILSERNRLQLEMFRDELGEEIANAIRAQMKEDDASADMIGLRN